ncbi:hypothetical protein [Nonomuraea sp. NPDC049158]
MAIRAFDRCPPTAASTSASGVEIFAESTPTRVAYVSDRSVAAQ